MKLTRILSGAGLATAVSAAGLVAWSRLVLDRPGPLPAAMPGRQERVTTSRTGAVSFYGFTEAEGRPLLLIHSINAAATAYEVRPLYLDAYGRRPVYALDLPGFGLSERSKRRYTPELMADAIHLLTALIRSRHGGARVDAVALSLSCTYLARAALERPGDYRSLGFISPTGFDGRLSGYGPPGGNRGRDGLRRALDREPFGRPLFDLLASRPSMRFFLGKTFGSPRIDEDLLDYAHASARQPGAEHAPYGFIAGHLFPTDATALYEGLRLPVFVAHGTRGDFVDYRLLPDFARRPNWRVVTLKTGAFPQFERPTALAAAYDGFLADVIPTPPRRPA